MTLKTIFSINIRIIFMRDMINNAGVVEVTTISVD